MAILDGAIVNAIDNQMANVIGDLLNEFNALDVHAKKQQEDIN